jgi:hypothetical protein
MWFHEETPQVTDPCCWCQITRRAFLLLLMMFWVFSPCRLVGRFKYFGETCNPHLRVWSGKIESRGIYMGSEEETSEEVGQSGTRNEENKVAVHSLRLPFPQQHINPSTSHLATSVPKMDTACFTEMLAYTDDPKPSITSTSSSRPFKLQTVCGSRCF